MSKAREQKRDSKHWQSVRVVVFERDDYRCRKCGAVGWASNPLTVQHTRPLLKLDDAFVLEDCVTLCRRCHGREDALRGSLR